MRSRSSRRPRRTLSHRGGTLAGPTSVDLAPVDKRSVDDGLIVGLKSLGATFNNNIESGKGFNGCTSLRFWNYKNFNGGGGADKFCASPCGTLGTFNNKASSLKVRKP